MSYKEETLEFLGINHWHELGYKGQGIKIMSDELILKTAPKSVSQELWDKVISPKGYSASKDHGTKVMMHLLMIAPEATFIAYPFNVDYKPDGYISECADYIIQNKVSIFTTSYTSGAGISQAKKRAIQDCIANWCKFFGSAGNGSEKGIDEEIKYEGYFAIGGVKPFYNVKTKKYDWNNLKRVGYSAIGEELDFVTIAEILGFTGTSFCSPVKGGMCGLADQFFKEETKHTLNQYEMGLFLKDHILDVDIEGFDIRTGFGLPRLPKELSSIDIKRYVPEYSKPTYVDYGGFPEVRGDVVMRGIDKLHPELQIAVNKFLAECKKQGLFVAITETLRTQAEQEALYAKGRTEPGKIVTNCRGYESPHCWGVSFDFCRNIKGWEYDNTDGFFDKVGQIAKTIFDNTEYDLFWGGDFRTFVDKPHIEMIKFMPDNSTKWLIDTYGTPEKFMETWNEGEVEDEMGEMLEGLITKYGKDKVKAAMKELVEGIVDNEDIAEWSKTAFEKMTKEDENGNSILAGVGNGEYDWKKPLTLERFAVLMLKMGNLK